MTDNRTTELLCKLLEERGLSCQTDYLHVVWRVGSKLYDAVDNFDGTLTVDNLTPEQAIVATLGGGTLTAEQVCEAIACNSWQETSMLFEFNDSSWQAIADELNARAERTCQFTIKDNMNESEGMGDVWIECSACHCVFDFYADEWLMKMSYCPNCGARVIKSDQYL